MQIAETRQSKRHAARLKTKSVTQPQPKKQIKTKAVVNFYKLTKSGQAFLVFAENRDMIFDAENKFWFFVTELPIDLLGKDPFEFAIIKNAFYEGRIFENPNTKRLDFVMTASKKVTFNKGQRVIEITNYLNIFPQNKSK